MGVKYESYREAMEVYLKTPEGRDRVLESLILTVKKLSSDKRIEELSLDDLRAFLSYSIATASDLHKKEPDSIDVMNHIAYALIRKKGPIFSFIDDCYDWVNYYGDKSKYYI